MAQTGKHPTLSKTAFSHRRSVNVASLARSQTSIFQTRHRLSSTSNPELGSSFSSSRESLAWSESSSDAGTAITPTSELSAEGADEKPQVAEVDKTKTHNERVLTKLLTQDPEVLRNSKSDGETGAQLIQKYCCGGGCCFLNQTAPAASDRSPTIDVPDNEAFVSLDLKLLGLSLDAELTGITPLPENTISFAPASNPKPARSSGTVQRHPPEFVQPHPPFHVFSAPLCHARELTKPGAMKRTFHFDIDVTDYPEENDVDFKVGGAIGICPPNEGTVVDDVFNLLGIPKFLRDKPVTLHTTGGRWPTIWGDEESRTLLTTRRELLTWCTDLQSYPPTKTLLRLLADYAVAPNEKQILLYLSSAQGQPSFCDLRTGPHLSLPQLLTAFPSSKPPLDHLLSVLNQLMPRFYSLSNDPHVSSSRDGLAGRRLIEIAVTVHKTHDWHSGSRTGVGSGFLERLARSFIAAEESALASGLATAAACQSARATLNAHIPMFRGLMANPLSREFGVATGPMMLIGAGVGMAPFRGFILNRLRDANCASKIWLVQGVRDASLDELYSGELGAYESQIKRVVQSRARRRPGVRHLNHLNVPFKANSETDLPTLLKYKCGKTRMDLMECMTEMKRTESTGKLLRPIQSYVQDEVRAQADVVWDVVQGG